MHEFNRISTYFTPLTGIGAYGLCDDTACLPKSVTPYVVSTDTIVSGVHFIGTESPYQLAQKLLAVNLSDLASVGAKPVCYTLNLTLPKNIHDKWFKGFCDGLAYMQRLYDIYLIGGDTTHFVTSHMDLVLSATVYGTDAHPTQRTQAKSGDVVCITAPTGLGYVGLQVALGKVSVDADMDKRVLQYYQTPTPHTHIGRKIAPYMHACCDISDGLVADLEHIAIASGVNITLHMPQIPISDMVSAYAQKIDIQHALLAGGDDYVLACTVPTSNIQHLTSVYANIHIIGTVSDLKTSPCVTVLNADTQDITPKNKGFTHI